MVFILHHLYTERWLIVLLFSEEGFLVITIKDMDKSEQFIIKLLMFSFCNDFNIFIIV